MNKEDFCHLHVHTEYSQLDGFGSLKNYVEKAVKNGQKFLAITDHGNIDGLIKFQDACDKAGIKPILGCEGYIVKDSKRSRKNKRGHVTLWVKNKKGFKNLCKLLTKANLEDFYHKPRITFDNLLKYSKGLCVGTACVQSFVLLEGGIEFFKKLKEKIGDDLYCEVMPHDKKMQHEINKKIIKLAKKTNTKIIVTNDSHYINKSDRKTQEVLLAIGTKAKWNDPKRFKFTFKGLYLRKTKEMIKMMKKTGIYKEEYLLNTLEIAEKCCDFRIPKMEIQLPHVPGVPKEEKNFLWKLCCEGYRNIFGDKIQNNREYLNRLTTEFTLICDKNFQRYFLMVWELCNWCKEQGILIGPGRGSVGGSLMAYLLGITSVDPLKYNLIFDRFINEDRVDYPDIDIDFEDTKRHLIKEHLAELYGEDNIAGVSSYSRLKPRAAVQDVARVFDVPPTETNDFTKLIDEEEEIGKIQFAIETYHECREYADKYPEVIKFAKKLENQVRGYSQHAAAIVVSMKDISKTGRCVLMDRDNTRLINWEKDDCEYVGLMKLDALGLKLLSILSHVTKLIKENYNKNIDLTKIDLDNKKVLHEITEGNTIGAFQINTWAMVNLIKEMGVEEFGHIVDSISLVRPGPWKSGMTENYILRKHGHKWNHMHEVYEELTKETYGLLVFQEQVMSVIHKVAGLPYSTADKIRKIIGKKRKKEEFEQYEKIFKRGCKKTKIFSKLEANKFWEGLQEWAKYGFNKSHSVEYAILAYWCMWLKVNYPTEFICASLTFGADEKKPELVDEAYRLGLVLNTPKIGLSDAFEWKAKDNILYIPFIETKGIGPVKAPEAANFKPVINKNKFFKKKNGESNIVKHKGSFGELLDKIKAYDINDNEITEEMNSLFKFRIVSNPKVNYANLYDLFDNKIRIDKLDKILSGDYAELRKLNYKFEKRKFKDYNYCDLSSCQKCELRNECKKPVYPSIGRKNVMIVGEAPGKNEDQEGKGFVGRSGEMIWKIINKKYKRSIFHVSNINKCYPSKSRKPNFKQIKTCGDTYLHEEIVQVQPILILAFGNVPYYFFENQKSGITQISGKTTWSEKYGCYIAWCLHPSATMHNPDNKTFFTSGMKNFMKLMKIFSTNNML